MDELDCIIDDLIPHKKSTAQQRYKLLAGLSAINKSHFNGTHELWILQD